MKKLLIFLGVTMLVAHAAHSQYVIKDAKDLVNLKKLPQEKVYVHHTGPLVFVGEYLKYAMYCFNTQSNKFSAISRVGYVALVNDKGDYLLEQKIPLTDGLSQGDFFINTDVPSGNYKLLGYTQWMKNSGTKQIFKDDLVIINPYQVDQSNVLGKNELVQTNAKMDRELKMDSTTVQIRFEQRNFGTREKVCFILKNYKGALAKGNYSIRIQKKSEFAVPPPQNAMDYGLAYLNVDKTITKNVGDYVFLPEQQGELFFGKAISYDTKEPAKGQEVVMSIPGDPYFLESTTTDDNGEFYVYASVDYKIPQVFIQSNGDEALQFEYGESKKMDVTGLSFGNFKLQPDYADVIKQRSIHNQVENQFFSVKPDSVVVEKTTTLKELPNFVSFHLDEYTRFRTLEETMVEILSYVGFRNNGDGPDYIHVTQKSEDYREEFIQTPALVLLDGIFIPDHGMLRDFDARLIRTIRVNQDKVKLGEKTYQGTVRLETIDGDYYNVYEPINGVKVPIKVPQRPKNYFNQQYNIGGSTLDNVPDYRRLLYWQPHVEVGETDMQFEFFTSDLTGEFEVILDGFTSYGKPIFSKSMLVVE